MKRPLYSLEIQRGYYFTSVLLGHTKESIVYISSLCRFLFLVFFFFGGLFLSANENYSQQVSAASFEWLVNMSMYEQWSCLTSAVLMKQLQMEKRALEGLRWWSTKFQMRKVYFPCIKGSGHINRPSFSQTEATHIPFLETKLLMKMYSSVIQLSFQVVYSS